MAVSTKQPQITLVLGPVNESSGPTVLPFLGLVLLAWVYVVDVQDSQVIVAAPAAFTSKLLNQSQLAFPIPAALVDAVAVFIPEALAALVGAKAIFALGFAHSAFAASAPSVREIAGPRAVFPGAILEAIGVHPNGFSASTASNRSGCWFHVFIVPQEPKYFDIAVKRIEAELKRTELFEPPPAIIRQTSLFNESNAGGSS